MIKIMIIIINIIYDCCYIYVVYSMNTTCVYDQSHFKLSNHMTMTSSGQIMSWPDYLKTKGNMNIKFWDLCEILIVYILLSTFQSVHMVLTVNKLDVRRRMAWIESADWNPWLVNCPSPVSGKMPSSSSVLLTHI